jgi:dimethylhistidine N-methyltransferase
MKPNRFQEQDSRRTELWPSIEGNGRQAPDNFRTDVLRGLSSSSKSVPCKYLYDQRGARLFEAICELEEYYPTRTEAQILWRNVDEIVSILGPRCRIIELGSGSSAKTRLLLDHLDRPANFVPVDVACEQLMQSAATLAREYPALEVRPVCADYTTDFNLPDLTVSSARTAALFLGSTIGNFEPVQAVEFLRQIGRFCGTDGSLLIGVDLKKDPDVLNHAYNDSQGVTADFNLNLLARMRRELQARVDLPLYQHHAFYNDPAGRIEMHLVSRRPQNIVVGERDFVFAKDETILTEHSYKYTPSEFRELAAL